MQEPAISNVGAPTDGAHTTFAPSTEIRFVWCRRSRCQKLKRSAAWRRIDTAKACMLRQLRFERCKDYILLETEFLDVSHPFVRVTRWIQKHIWGWVLNRNT